MFHTVHEIQCINLTPQQDIDEKNKLFENTSILYKIGNPHIEIFYYSIID